jgi:histidine triad (HIT) family protein
MGAIFESFSDLLPVNRLWESDTLVAFYHPKPGYPVHVLIVPKRSITSITELGDQDADFLTDLVQCVRILVSDLDLENSGYRLISNGGKYQDVPQLHFHLVSGDSD